VIRRTDRQTEGKTNGSHAIANKKWGFKFNWLMMYLLCHSCKEPSPNKLQLELINIWYKGEYISFKKFV